MSEFAVRFEGGRFDGITTIAKDEPPKEVVAVAINGQIAVIDVNETCRYRQIARSKLPEDFEHPNVMRGGVWEVY